MTLGRLPRWGRVGQRCWKNRARVVVEKNLSEPRGLMKLKGKRHHAVIRLGWLWRLLWGCQQYCPPIDRSGAKSIRVLKESGTNYAADRQMSLGVAGKGVKQYDGTTARFDQYFRAAGEERTGELKHANGQFNTGLAGGSQF